jgi:hypothetical protein
LPTARKHGCFQGFRGDATTGNREVTVPLSRDEQARSRQLANLRRGGPPAEPGNGLALKHGGHSELLLADVEAEVRELVDALGSAAPVRAADGGLPDADVPAVEQAARALRRYRSLSAWCDAHGRLEERTGKVKPAADLELRAERALGLALDALAMTPRSRARLGLDLARSVDVASALSEPDPGLRR